MQKKILANPQKYYGAYVDYTTTNTLSEKYKWRIFYATNSNIYLIASDYVSVADLPTTAKGNKPANSNTSYPKAAPFNNIINDYTGSASITEDMKWFNKDYFDKGYSSTNNNMKAVAYLLDKAIWTDKFKGNGAEYVVGGPSLDMVLTSYNQYTNQNNLQVDSFKKSLKFKQKIRANFRPVIYYCPYFLIFSQKMAQKADFNNKLKFFYIYYFLNLRIIQCKMKWQSNILLRIKCYLKKC